MSRGWYNQSYRHSLARRGIRTSRAVVGGTPAQKKLVYKIIGQNPRLAEKLKKTTEHIYLFKDLPLGAGGTSHMGYSQYRDLLIAWEKYKKGDILNEYDEELLGELGSGSIHHNMVEGDVLKYWNPLAMGVGVGKNSPLEYVGPKNPEKFKEIEENYPIYPSEDDELPEEYFKPISKEEALGRVLRHEGRHKGQKFKLGADKFGQFAKGSKLIDELGYELSSIERDARKENPNEVVFSYVGGDMSYPTHEMSIAAMGKDNPKLKKSDLSLAQLHELMKRSLRNIKGIKSNRWVIKGPEEERIFGDKPDFVNIPEGMF